MHATPDQSEQKINLSDFISNHKTPLGGFQKWGNICYDSVQFCVKLTMVPFPAEVCLHAEHWAFTSFSTLTANTVDAAACSYFHHPQEGKACERGDLLLMLCRCCTKLLLDSCLLPSMPIDKTWRQKYQMGNQYTCHGWIRLRMSIVIRYIDGSSSVNCANDSLVIPNE